MPINAKFTADFTSFNEAVQKAEVELRGFETGAGKVEKALSRMVDNFSGRHADDDRDREDGRGLEALGG
jgi:hypothetical protein